VPRKIVPERSAIASRPCARSIRMAAPELSASAAAVADVGCGYMAGTLELLRHHRQVYAVDTELQRGRIGDRIALCSRKPNFAGFMTNEEFGASRVRLDGAYVVNVLHVLPAKSARVELLRMVREKLKRNGFALLDVPYYEHYYKGRMTRENQFRDGYLFQQGGDVYTFYRFTTADELDAWAQAAGLRFKSRVVDNHHHARIYEPA
jgi:SAM-dependent methyltransferase